ncbi:MAG: hypothetical protein AB1Z98_25120 [Nannocystaceae bacterium]
MRRYSQWLAWGSVATLIAACDGESSERDDEAGGPGIGSLSQGLGSATDGTATGDGSGTGATTDDIGDDSSGPPATKFDLGMLPDLSSVDSGCTKVDFLFIIDSSGSMGDDQDNLVANFPAFITGIQSVLESVDEYQVGIVTTDQYGPNVPGCHQLSSLVARTGGADSSNAECGPFAAGHNFMTELDDLASEFTCAADVGTSGDFSERPMEAMIGAVQQVQGGPGECNEGFLRPDSLLVVVIITDESGDDSGNSVTWFDDVVTARGGIEENIAVVSLINTPGGGCPNETAHAISAFTNMFTNGFEAPVCTGDYGPSFTQAIDVIDQACDNFIPG